VITSASHSKRVFLTARPVPSQRSHLPVPTQSTHFDGQTLSSPFTVPAMPAAAACPRDVSVYRHRSSVKYSASKTRSWPNSFQFLSKPEYPNGLLWTRNDFRLARDPPAIGGNNHLSLHFMETQAKLDSTSCSELNTTEEAERVIQEPLYQVRAESAGSRAGFGYLFSRDRLRANRREGREACGH
jgi:hypothetical protein